MQYDLQTASAIASKYLELNEGEPLGFIEVILNKSNSKIELKTPDWIAEISDHFREQYGHEHGHAITTKVLTKFLLKNETIH